MSEIDSEMSFLAHEREEIQNEKQRLTMERQLFDKKAEELDLKGLAMQIAKHDLYEAGQVLVSTPSLARVRSALGAQQHQFTCEGDGGSSCVAGVTPQTRNRIVSRSGGSSLKAASGIGTQGSILNPLTPATQHDTSTKKSIGTGDSKRAFVNKENNFRSPLSFDLAEPTTPATKSLLQKLGHLTDETSGSTITNRRYDLYISLTWFVLIMDCSLAAFTTNEQ